MKIKQEVLDQLITLSVTVLTSILMKFGRRLRGKSSSGNTAKPIDP